MRLFIDVDSQKLVQVAGSRSALTSVDFKRGDSARIEVQFVSGTTVQELSGTSITGVFGLKEAGKYDTGTYIVSDLAWSKEGTGTSTKYVFEPDFATTALNTLLASGDGDDTNDVASVTLMGEISWTIDGAIYSTQKFDAVVFNDVIKGGEGAAGVAPVFGTTVPTNAAAASLTTGAGNSGVTWTAVTAGSAGNDISVVTENRNGTTSDNITVAAEDGNAVTITRGARSQIRMQEGADDTGFLLATGNDAFSDGVVWSTDGNETPPGSGTWWSCSRGSGIWTWQEYLNGSTTGTPITSDDDSDYPDSVSYTSFSETVSIDYPTAAQVKAAADSSLTIVSATLPGTGADTFAAVSPADNLEGGLDTTATPPHIRVADGKMFIQESGTWKQVALSALS